MPLVDHYSTFTNNPISVSHFAQNTPYKKKTQGEKILQQEVRDILHANEDDEQRARTAFLPSRQPNPKVKIIPY